VTSSSPDPAADQPAPDQPVGEKPAAGAPADPTTGATPSHQPKPKDPLRGSRTSGVWVAVLGLLVLLVLMAIFILQNTQSVEVSFLGWTGSAPLSASLLIAVVAGMLLAVSAGALRIMQLRRRVKRSRKS